MIVRELIFRLSCAPLVCLFLGVSGTAQADQTLYQYDAQGRLLQSCVTWDGPAAGWDTDFVHDRADNRSYVGIHMRALSLTAGQQIFSPNGNYRLTMQGDGNLVLYGPAGAIWATGTLVAGSSASFQADGNLVVYSGSGAVLWASNTSGNHCSYLQVRDNGKAVIVASGEVTIWSVG